MMSRYQVLRSALTCVRCGLCALAGLGIPSAVAADEPLLHEYVPGIDPEEVHAALRSRGRGVGAAAVAARGNGSGAGDEAAGSGSARNPAMPNLENFRPDRLTSLEGGLDYYEAFNPAIAPFKRMTAFDAVRLDVDEKTPVLGVLDARLREVSVEGASAPAPDPRPRDRFRGEADLDFHGGGVQPLPSVSPESRVLSLSTEPAVDALVERDGADNFFLRVRGPVPNGKLHVRWETDAPRAYFGADIPARPLRALPKIVQPAATIVRRAQHFAGELGIGANSDLRTTLEKLTAHFRNFVESADPPADTGDLYSDLVTGGKGLCRHRAYGFVVTARSLGIDARFVQNEAHSWVEVRLPDTGFLRIDLGGATHGLTAHDVSARRSYVPAQPDTLPRPAAYKQSHAQAAREPGAKLEEPTELASSAGRWLPDDSEARASAAAASGEQSRGGDDQPELPPETLEPTKRPMHIALDERKLSALRGGKLVLTGRALDDADRGVPGLRVEVWIVRRGRAERMLLAVQVSDDNGYFRADFGVPPDLAVGDYRLLVRSEGDATHAPALTE